MFYHLSPPPGSHLHTLEPNLMLRKKQESDKTKEFDSDNGFLWYRSLYFIL